MAGLWGGFLWLVVRPLDRGFAVAFLKTFGYIALVVVATGLLIGGFEVVAGVGA